MGQHEEAIELLKRVLGAEIMAEYTTDLDCGHTFTTRVAPPKNGDSVWCNKCRSYAMVPWGRKGQREAWYVTCDSCRMGRYCGRDKSYAVNRAIRHMRKQGLEHVVHVWWTSNKAGTIERVTIPDTPLPGLVPPDGPFPF